MGHRAASRPLHHRLSRMSELTTTQLASVSRHLVDRGTLVSGELGARLIAGGRSNLTYEITDGSSRWVLRRPPTAGLTPSAHDVAREFRVTAALARTDVPVARPLLIVDDDQAFGAPYSVVDFVEGTTIRHRDEVDALDASTIASSTTHLLETLAQLHSVDHREVGLESFGRPDAYAARQVRRWSGQWEIVGNDRTGDAERLAAALRRRIPDQPHTSIVHGDYRGDNALVDVTDGGRVTAVVDWELSTIGDPVADVAMMTAYRHPALDLILGFPSAWTSDRLPDSAALAAGYERAGGVPLDHWEFHRALAFFKLAVISAGIDHRHRAGGTSGDGFATAGAAVGILLEEGLSALSGD